MRDEGGEMEFHGKMGIYTTPVFLREGERGQGTVGA